MSTIHHSSEALEIERKVRAFLEARFEGMESDLSAQTGGRLHGQVVWDGFEGHDLSSRQTMVREALSERFGAESQRVGVVLTYTPGEIEWMRET